jgi:hypothetical protein
MSELVSHLLKHDPEFRLHWNQNDRDRSSIISILCSLENIELLDSLDQTLLYDFRKKSTLETIFQSIKKNNLNSLLKWFFHYLRTLKRSLIHFEFHTEFFPQVLVYIAERPLIPNKELIDHLVTQENIDDLFLIFMHASSVNNKEVIDYLLTSQLLLIHADHRYPIHMSLHKGFYNLAALFVKKEPSLINCVDGLGRTLLHHCYKTPNESEQPPNSCLNFVSLLLEKDPSLLYKKDLQGLLPFETLCFSKNYFLINFLLSLQPGFSLLPFLNSTLLNDHITLILKNHVQHELQQSFTINLSPLYYACFYHDAAWAAEITNYLKKINKFNDFSIEPLALCPTTLYPVAKKIHEDQLRTLFEKEMSLPSLLFKRSNSLQSHEEICSDERGIKRNKL